MKRRTVLTENQMKILRDENTLSDTEAWKEFVVAKQIQGVSNNTIKHYENVRRVIFRDLPKVNILKDIKSLSNKEIEELILFWKTDVKVPTINSRIRVMKVLYSTLKHRKIINKDPMKDIHQLKEKEIIKDTLTKDEIAIIAKYFKSKATFAQYRNLVIFELLLDTGLRISEALSIKKYNVLEDSIIINKTKSKKQRVIFPSAHCLHSIRTYLKILGHSDVPYLFVTVDGNKLSKRQFQGELKKASQKISKKSVSPHMLRRTYAKHAVLNGIDPFSLARLMGHEDINTTKRYVQIYGSDLKEQSKKRGEFGSLFK